MSTAYVTLLSGQTYLPGVVTLGHKLRELEVKHDLIALVNVESITKKSLDLIESIYDKVISISLINADSGVEDKLGRSELNLTYSKILLWNQPYDKLVYLDADTLPLKNLDHLFELEFEANQIAASSDAGWPDIFNTGVLVLKPNKPTYDALITASETVESFDGADQGLFNEHFNITSQGSNWVKLPFLFNVTPNFQQSYQYLPAFNRFFKDIQVLHFIGENKPWFANSILQSDTANFHHLWWAQFNKLDEATKSQLLASKGEASQLKFAKLQNTWDVANDSAPTSAEQASSVPSIFPWENRGANTPTRVFDSHGNPEYIGLARLDDKLNENIQKLNLKTKTKKSSFSEESGFNPTKSLDEVAKIPLKFLSKQKEQDDEEK